MSLKSADVDTVSPSQDQRGLPLRPSHHGQETRLLRWIVAEHAGKAAGERHRAMLCDAAHRHEGMLRPDHHFNSPRLENFFDIGRDLYGKILLGLTSARAAVTET